eukprot:3540557-Amphidinium_carterae.1
MKPEAEGCKSSLRSHEEEAVIAVRSWQGRSCYSNHQVTDSRMSTHRVRRVSAPCTAAECSVKSAAASGTRAIRGNFGSSDQVAVVRQECLRCQLLQMDQAGPVEGSDAE